MPGEPAYPWGRRLLGALAGAVVWSVLGPAQAGDLSLAQCLQMAGTRSPQAVEAALQTLKAKASLDSAAANRWPRISAVAQYSTSDDLSTQLPDDNQALLTAQQNLLPFLSPDWIRTGQNAEEFQAARSEEKATRQDVELMVKELYFSILRDQETLRRMDLVQGDYGALLEDLGPQFTMGRYPRFDEVKVKASLADLAREHARASIQLNGEEQNLALALGMDGTADLGLQAVTLVPGLPDGGTVGGPDADPALEALRWKADAARIGLDADSFERLPSLTADFRCGYTAPTWGGLSRGWDATVQLNLPLLDWGLLSAQADRDRADLKLAQDDYKTQEKRFSARVAQAFDSAQADLADYRRMEGLLPEAQRASQAALKQYRTGAMGIVETTDAVDLWLRTELNDRNAYYAYLSDLARLERLTGAKVDYE